jgi:uncharacterized protein
MKWNLVSLEGAAPQPWRNGGGATRELLAWPSAQDWQVRVSVADVQSPGPFSRFDGIERWFAVLEGDGVVLRIDGHAHRLTGASEPLRFDGGRPVECTEPGHGTRDFNLMAAPGRASLRWVRGMTTVTTDGPRLLALYAHLLPAMMNVHGVDVRVPAGHLAWCRTAEPAAGTIEAADALWMEVLS